MTAPSQYRPCPLPVRAAGPGQPGSAAADADDVHQHADVGARPTRSAAPSTARAAPERTNRRNGYRHRDFDTRAGTMDVAIPKLRDGVVLPGLAAGAPPAGRAGADHGGRDLLPARGVAPGGWRSWSRPSGITRLSKSQVIGDGHATSTRRSRTFRTRPLDAGPVHVRGRRRAGAEGPRGRPGGQRARPGRDRRQRRRAPGDPRPAGHLAPRTAPAGWRSSAT